MNNIVQDLGFMFIVQLHKVYLMKLPKLRKTSV